MSLLLTLRSLGEPAGGATFEYTGSGGLTFSGAASLSRTQDWIASGGLTFSGAAALAKVKAVSAAGGLVFGGSAVTFKTPYTYTPSGGITFSGAAELAKVKAVTAAGGITFGGAAAVARTQDWISSGGLVFGGAALTSSGSSATFEYMASGGLAIAGAAATEYAAAGAPVVEEPRRDAGGGAVTWRLPLQIRVRPVVQPRIYAIAGAGGLVFGGAAETQFLPVPKLAAEILAVIRRRAPSGSAEVTFVDALADARVSDHDELLMGGLL